MSDEQCALGPLGLSCGSKAGFCLRFLPARIANSHGIDWALEAGQLMIEKVD